MDALWQDIRYGARRLARSPGFTLVAVLTLALGIGANSAIFSVVNAVLLRPLPYAEPDRLLTVFHFYPSLGKLEAGMAAPTFQELREEARIFDRVGARQWWTTSLTGHGHPEQLQGGQVSGEFFATLGVPAAIGRTILPEEAEEQRKNVVVLGHGLWQRLYGGDPAAVGRTVQLSGEAYEIVGVMPAGFRDPISAGAQIWRPIAFTPQQLQARTNEFMSLVARLTPGVAPERAERELAALAERLKTDNPGEYPPDWSLRGRTLDRQLTGNVRPALLVLLGAVGFVLLIACANVANLLLARASARHKEVAIRSALGATRADLARQHLVESVLLALLGAAIALVLASLGVQALVALNPDGLPRADEIAIDGTVLLFTLGVAVLTGLLFGLVPALRATRTDLQRTLREGGRGGAANAGGHTVRRVLVVAQVALALTLLVGAGLLIRSFARLQSVDPGFEAENLLTFNLTLPPASYGSDTAQIAFFNEALARIRAVPGVQGVGASSVLPFSGGVSTASFGVEGLALGAVQPDPWGDIRIVNHGYQEALRVPLLRGRFFTEQDRAGSRPVVVVDREMAERYWPGQDPLGKRLALDTDPQTGAPQWKEIVGVVEHVDHEGLGGERRVQLYLPYRQTATGSLGVAIRASGDPRRLLGSVRAALATVDPALPLSGVHTMEDLLSSSLGQRRFVMLLLGLFAAIALLLASVGIYGVVSFDVARRSQEIGIRMALGAEHTRVLRLVMRQGILLVAAGVALGLLAALALTRLLASQLYGIGTADPLTFGAVAALLLGVAVLATLVPARRAARVDPVVALRAE
jgi:putative ABC transport system permease protein